MRRSLALLVLLTLACSGMDPRPEGSARPGLVAPWSALDLPLDASTIVACDQQSLSARVPGADPAGVVSDLSAALGVAGYTQTDTWDEGRSARFERAAAPVVLVVSARLAEGAVLLAISG